MTQKAQKSRNSGCSRYFLILFGIGWASFSSIFLVTGIVQEEWVFAGIGGLFVLIGLAIMIGGLLTLFSRFLVGEPEIMLSKQHDLAVGETIRINYTHSFRRRVLIEKLSINLIFREKATYQQGTDTKTVTYNDIIDFYEEPGHHYESGELIQGSHEFQIPVHGMHTLKVRRNELTWILQFKLEVANLPDYVDEYELTVLPQVLNHV